jgi:hypothetical protein
LPGVRAGARDGESRWRARRGTWEIKDLTSREGVADDGEPVQGQVARTAAIGLR